MKWFIRLLILLLLAALVVIPSILAGTIYLAWARAAREPIAASQYYESAARRLFWRPELYEQAGLQATDDPLRAIRLLKTARQAGTLSSQAQLALGDAYLENAETDQALTEWEALFANKQEITAIGPRLARIYHQRQDYENEERVLQAWQELDAGNPLVNESLGRLLAASGDPRALALLEIASSASPQSAARLAQLRQALQSPAEDPAYRLTLCGQALAQLDEWPLALRAFASAVETNPQYPSAWGWLGLARQHTRTQGALAALEQAVRLDGQSAPLRAMLGSYWQQNGLAEKAQAEFLRATNLEPDNATWWMALAGAQARGDLSAALSSYMHAVSLAPDAAETWYALALFCVENEAYIEEYGLNAALRAFALAPDQPLYMDLLGRAQMAAGQPQAAEALFKKALAAGTPASLPGHHLHLGLLYLQTAREAQAKDEFQQTLAIDPQGVYGAQAKKLLERYFP